MSTIRLLSEQLQLSSFTVSAALRGRPGVGSTTRDRVLKQAREMNYPVASYISPFRGSIAILRVVSLDGRGRASVSRHRALCRGAREEAQNLGYGAEEVTLEVNDTRTLASLVANRDCRGLLLLPGPEPQALGRFCITGFPCVYADAPPAGLSVASVGPDYNQAIVLAFRKMNSLGFKKPGLMLDRDLPEAALEQLLAVYNTCFGAFSASKPTPFVTPARKINSFGSWLKGHAFDALLATDVEHAKRLLFADEAVPIFGLNPDAGSPARGVDLNLVSVGKQASRILLKAASELGGASTPRSVTIPPCWMDGPFRMAKRDNLAVSATNKVGLDTDGLNARPRGNCIWRKRPQGPFSL